MISLSVNGTRHQADVPPEMPLLWFVRETLGLTGTKYGCGIALCGACTVHIDGAPVRSCVTPVSAADGKHVTRSSRAALRARGYAAPGAVDDPGRSCTRRGHPIPKEFRGIGLRIEDDVLITTDGCAVADRGHAEDRRGDRARVRRGTAAHALASRASRAYRSIRPEHTDM